MTTPQIPKDSSFFVPVRHKLEIALVRAAHHELDQDGAQNTAKLVAHALDSGTFPPGYHLPRLRSHFDRHGQNEAAALVAAGKAHPAGTDGKGQPITLPVGPAQPFRSEAERAAADQREKALPALRSKEEITAENDKTLASFADLSFSVRDDAAAATILRILIHPDLTGARPQDALDIAAIEIERSIRLHREYSMPYRSADTEIGALPEDVRAEQAVDVLIGTLPFPASVSAAISLQMLGEHSQRFHADSLPEVEPLAPPPIMVSETLNVAVRSEIVEPRSPTEELRAVTAPAHVEQARIESAVREQTDPVDPFADLEVKLSKAKALFDKGLMSEVDYTTMKMRLLGSVG